MGLCLLTFGTVHFPVSLQKPIAGDEAVLTTRQGDGEYGDDAV